METHLLELSWHRRIPVDCRILELIGKDSGVFFLDVV